MFLYKLFAFCFLYRACFAIEDPVLEFTDSDFDDRIADHETTLVMFYAPWCTHCKRLKPEFTKAAEVLTASSAPVTLAKIDCTKAGSDTCQKYDVSGYPTLKIFRKGEFSQDYNGPREAEGIVKYMKTQVGAVSTELSSVEDFEKFIQNEDEDSVVGFFEDDSYLKRAFLQMASKMHRARFAHSTATAVLEKQGITDGIVLFRPPHLHNKFENDSVVYSGNAEVGEIEDFILKNYHGLVGHRKYDNIDDFQNPLVVAYYHIDYEMNSKSTNYWRNRVLKVAKEYKDKMNFAISSKEDFQYELSEYGIEHNKEDKPIVLARDKEDQKFMMEDPFSVEALNKFVQNFLDGKLEPFIRSEPIPETNDGPVIVAVGKNFNDVVVNNGKDTFIKFYAQWSLDSTKLEPIYKELGEKMKDEDVAIVKMEATFNEVPATFEINTYQHPNLYWAPKDSKDKPVRYEGGRELDDFIKYIAKHATTELKGYDRDGKPKTVKTEL